MSDNQEKDWCWEIADLMERFHGDFLRKHFGEKLPDDQLEDGWQLRVTIECIKPVYSTISFNAAQSRKAKAKQIGGVLGHDVSRYQTLCRSHVWNHFCSLSELVAKSTGRADFIFSRQKNIFAESLQRYEKTVARAMGYAVCQPDDEQAMFFEGYAKALRKGSINTKLQGVAHTTRTHAYQVILLCAPILKDEWKSVGDVHKFLEKTMGKQLAGTLKRTENLCRFIGLKLRNVGRPISRFQSPH